MEGKKCNHQRWQSKTNISCLFERVLLYQEGLEIKKNSLSVSNTTNKLVKCPLYWDISRIVTINFAADVHMIYRVYQKKCTGFTEILCLTPSRGPRWGFAGCGVRAFLPAGFGIGYENFARYGIQIEQTSFGMRDRTKNQPRDAGIDLIFSRDTGSIHPHRGPPIC